MGSEPATARLLAVLMLLGATARVCGAPPEAGPTREQALQAMRRAATFYRTRAAAHGGYVYHYSPDLRQRWGEGPATADQIWVQPPGTPTVGMAYLAYIFLRV